MPKPLNHIEDYNFSRDMCSPLDLNIEKSIFNFPTLDELKTLGVFHE